MNSAPDPRQRHEEEGAVEEMLKHANKHGQMLHEILKINGCLNTSMAEWNNFGAKSGSPKMNCENLCPRTARECKRVKRSTEKTSKGE